MELGFETGVDHSKQGEWMASQAGALVGALVAMYLLSSLVGFIALRSAGAPRKQLISVLIAWAMATVLAGFGMADGGAPQFVPAAAQYGLAGLIVLAIKISVHHLRRAKDS